MILVTVGTEKYPFDRLIKYVDRLIEDGVFQEEVLVQTGFCKHVPRHARSIRFLPFEEMYQQINKASLILAHAGAGTTLLSLQAGRPLILVPRSSHLREHVDNHQRPFAMKMNEERGVMVADDYDQLKAGISHVRQMPQPAPSMQRPELAAFLHGFLRKTATMNIGGVEIHNISTEQSIVVIEDMIRIGRPEAVITANVDHIVKLQRDDVFRNIYRKTALVVADGVPLLWAARFLGEPLREKISGSDLFPRLCGVAQEKGWKLFFLGGREGAAVTAAKVLRTLYPKVQIVGMYSPPYGFDNDEMENARIVTMIRQTQPDIVFVGLGAPKQEKWIDRFKDAYRAPVSIGIGVSFEFVAGIVKRAPLWMQHIGLEWFWRLMMEPCRLWRRYLIEDLVFFKLVFRQKFPSKKIVAI